MEEAVLHDWMLAYTMPRHELKLAQRLQDAGFEVYCPTVKTIKQWSDRKKKVEEPLFKSYIFIRTSVRKRQDVVIQPGFSRFVYWQGRPVLVKEEIIAETKRFLDLVNHETIVHQELTLGKEVKIIAGPLQKSKGKIIELRNNKVLLHIDALGTIIAAELSVNHVSL